MYNQKRCAYNERGGQYMKIKLTQEQIETMSYADVAHLILSNNSKKIKIQDLFKKVLKAMGLPESHFTEGIGDFFDAILIDKRFIMLENGFCDLKINHSTKIVFDDEEEDLDIVDDIVEEVEEDSVEINFNEDSVEDDNESELEDLVIITDSDDDDEDE
jgi:DNA-directed RNA polymerase subunit delta